MRNNNCPETPNESDDFASAEDRKEVSSSPRAKYEESDLWYDKGREKFVMKLPDDSWLSAKKDLTKINLGRHYGLTDHAEKDEKGRVTDENSEIDYALSGAMIHRKLEFTLRGLSGHEAGIENTIEGATYLIERSANWVTPVKGDWLTIKLYLNQLFGEEQLVYVLGLLTYAIRDYYEENRTSRPAMVLAGPKKCGKNLFQDVIVSNIFGGSMADPTQSMYGATTFNSELFSAAHLMIADTLHSSDPKCKAALESAIKMTTATRYQRVHGKGKEAMNGLQPFWFLTVSLNDDGDGLSLLPRPTGSMEDKMMLFQVVRPAILPNTREEVQSVFIPKLEAEIPALIHYLLHEHVVPEDLRTDRAGILPYQNPDLVAEIVGESREAIVGNHLYTVYFLGQDENTKDGKRSFTAHEIFCALDSREQISRSLARMRVTESSIGRILTAICNRPIADAPVLLEKRKSNGKLLYDLACNVHHIEAHLDKLREKLERVTF
jgi:hypothetical protein